MGEGAPLAAERLDREPHAPAALADLPGDESRERDVPLAQQLCEALQGRRLARARARLDQREHAVATRVRAGRAARAETLAVAPEVVRVLSSSTRRDRSMSRQ